MSNSTSDPTHRLTFHNGHRASFEPLTERPAKSEQELQPAGLVNRKVTRWSAGKTTMLSLTGPNDEHIIIINGVVI